MKNNNSLISIIIITYNRVNIVDNAIKSCLNQTYKNIEIIIIDDCSQDNTYNYLLNKYKNYNNIHIYRNNINSGEGYSRNIGVEYSSGKYITFLDDDDIFSKNYCLECINNINSYDLIIPNLKKKIDLLSKEFNYKSVVMICGFLEKDKFIKFKEERKENIVLVSVYWKIDLFLKYKKIKLMNNIFYYSDFKYKDKDTTLFDLDCYLRLNLLINLYKYLKKQVIYLNLDKEIMQYIYIYIENFIELVFESFKNLDYQEFYKLFE
jgi:glycosyltransferase involved in cell wall biosynthesis